MMPTCTGRIANARPGEYVRLTVGDTGHGMSPEVLKHAMELLFTTKEPGKGTGLGLATVHSTVQRSGGFVAIDSTVDEGTSVDLYFPKAEPGPIVSHARPTTEYIPLGDGELILLVEDNDRVREATVNRLENARLRCPRREDRTRGDQVASVRKAHCPRVQ